MRARAGDRGQADALWQVEWAAFVAGAKAHELPGGECIVHPEVPEVWDASFVYALRPSVDLDRLLDAVAPIFRAAGCGHQKIWLRDPEHFDTLGPALLARGFGERRMVLMRTASSPTGPETMAGDPPPAGLRIHPVRGSADRERLATARAASRRDAPWFSPEVSLALDAWEDLQARTLDLQWLVATLDQEPAGAVGLLQTPDGASLQSLSTATHLRRQGIGQALVARVRWLAHKAGHRTLSLLTDLEAPPRALYRRLGFHDRLEVRAYQRAV